MYERWYEVKKFHIRDNTICNYNYMYTTYVKPNFGRKRLKQIVKTDVKKFYNTLIDERRLSISAVETIQNVLRQVFQTAVEDNIITKNPCENLFREYKASRNFNTEKKKALSKPQQELFINFLKNSPKYNHWYPIFAVMLGTGLRVGEVTGLRWCDVDFDKNVININHTLVNYSKGKGKGNVFAVNPPKTKAGIRTIPMFPEVREAFLAEKKYQEEFEIECATNVGGYTDFIFVNRFGENQHQGTLNKAIKRIIRDCNDEVLAKQELTESTVLLPNFSCHILRHSFTTRLCEVDVNPKSMQVVLGHSDIRTTLQIYADVTEEHKQETFNSIEDFFRGIL